MEGALKSFTVSICFAVCNPKFKRSATLSNSRVGCFIAVEDAVADALDAVVAVAAAACGAVLISTIVPGVAVEDAGVAALAVAAAALGAAAAAGLDISIIAFP